jgi:hypothetical protein
MSANSFSKTAQPSIFEDRSHTYIDQENQQETCFKQEIETYYTGEVDVGTAVEIKQETEFIFGQNNDLVTNNSIVNNAMVTDDIKINFTIKSENINNAVKKNIDVFCEEIKHILMTGRKKDYTQIFGYTDIYTLFNVQEIVDMVKFLFNYMQLELACNIKKYFTCCMLNTKDSTLNTNDSFISTGIQPIKHIPNEFRPYIIAFINKIKIHDCDFPTYETYKSSIEFMNNDNASPEHFEKYRTILYNFIQDLDNKYASDIQSFIQSSKFSSEDLALIEDLSKK